MSLLSRLLQSAYELVMGVDREGGERLAREAGSHLAVWEFLEDHPDVGCPWCGIHDEATPHHAHDCELVAKAF